MERYGSGTRVLLSGRSRSDIVYQTTVGSPVRYDAAIVSGCVQFPAAGTNGFSYCRMPIVGPKTSITSTELWSSAQYFAGGNPSASGFGAVRLMAWIRPSGQVVAYLGNSTIGSFITNTYWLYVYNGAGFTQVGPALTIPNNTLCQLVVKVIPGIGGEVTAWVNGVLGFSNVGGLNANFDEIGFVDFCSPFNTISYMSQYGLANEDLRSYSFGDDVLTANGFYDDGTGDAADTGDTDLSTYKGLPANLDKFTGTSPARTLPGNTVIDGIMLSTVSRTSSPIGNAKGLLRMSSTNYLTAVQSPVPNAGFEYGQVTYDTNPATDLPWVLADYNSAEKGQEANT
jgi:hypothetical protein